MIAIMGYVEKNVNAAFNESAEESLSVLPIPQNDRF